MNILQILFHILNGIIETFCVSYATAIVLRLVTKSNNAFEEKKVKIFIKFWMINAINYVINKTIHLFMPELNWIKPLSYILIVSLACKLCYKVKFYKGAIASVLLLAYASILEIVSVLILKGFDVSVESIANNIYYNSLYACVLGILEALSAFIINKFHKSLAGVENKLKYFLPQFIAIIICMIPTMVLLIFNYYKYSALFIVLNLVQLVVVTLVGVYSIRFVAKHENTELELANTITYNETLKKVNEGVRGFKHDMGNIVQAILGYIAINDSEGAKRYCQNLVIGFNDINILSILSPKVIDDPAIYGVVVNKILMARDKNMTLSLDINLNVSEIDFPKFELSRMLGILIDNAIEAGEQTNDKKLIVNMRRDEQRYADIIVISNSINDTSIDTHKIFEKNYSTKENPSGFGLYEVNKFIKQNPNSYIVTTIDKNEKLFTQTLTIHYKPSLNLINSTINEESTVA